MEIRQFGNYLKTCNRLEDAGFQEWIFFPGMLFRSPEKWWGNKGIRPAPHEGLDICLYATKDGRQMQFDKSTKIPVGYNGKIVRIIKDFLGKSLYVRHDIQDDAGRYFYSLYGHTLPSDSLRKGSIVNAGDIIGTVSDIRKKTGILPHLHISMAWIPASRAPETLDWDTVGTSAEIILLNPLDALGDQYAVIR